MKRFDRLMRLLPLIFLLIIAAADGMLLRTDAVGRQYLVDANRIEQQILNGETPDADAFSTVTGIFPYDGSADFFRTNGEYLLREIGGTMYRIDYTDSPKENQ